MKRILTILLAGLIISASTVSAAVVGDFNDDGQVNIFDVIYLLQVLRGSKQPGNIGMHYVLDGGEVNLPGGTLPVDTVQGLPMVMVPSGSFVMGSTVSPTMMQGMWPAHMQRAVMHAVGMDSLWMGTIEITRRMFEDVMGFDPSSQTDSDSLPVQDLSWFDAARFCNALSEAAGFETCYDTTTWEVDFAANGFRLPTEAEWEYACRAGSATLFYSGNDEQDLERAGWFDANSQNMIHPVGELAPNNWGLYDMMGNVAEWCNDWYDEQYYGSNFMDVPAGPDSGSDRVVRGGSYDSIFSYCASSYRDFDTPDSQQQTIGLRVVRRAGGN